MNEQEREQFKAAVNEFDWLGTIPDERYCDHVHSALLEGVFATAEGLGINLQPAGTKWEDDDVDIKWCFDVANENFLRYLLGESKPTGKVRIAQLSCDWKESITGEELSKAIKDVDTSSGAFVSDYPQDAVDSKVMFVSSVELTQQELDLLWESGDLGTGDKDAWEGDSVADIAAQLREHKAVMAEVEVPLTKAELDRMVEEIAEYLQTEATAEDVMRVYNACT
jgi:hypothetical protein